MDDEGQASWQTRTTWNNGLRAQAGMETQLRLGPRVVLGADRELWGARLRAWVRVLRSLRSARCARDDIGVQGPPAMLG
jgi:hypothetical protein